MEHINKYRKTIQGTSNRHLDINEIMERSRIKNVKAGQKSQIAYAQGKKRLPPLPDNYFGSQIDEVSSARDSIIENESQMN